MKDLEKRIAGLSPEKRALFELLLQKRLKLAGHANRIPRRVGSGPVQISYTQERLWFLQKLFPGTALYNEASAYLLSGKIDYRALEASLNGVFERHEILRTVFLSQAGIPYQVARPFVSQNLSVIELTGLSAEDGLSRALEMMQVEINRPYDLERDWMMRCFLYRLGEDRHVLLEVHNHIVSDWWSTRRLQQELWMSYRSYADGQKPVLPELEIQYADFAVWERQWLQGERMNELVNYWWARLSGLPRLELQKDRPYPVEPTFQGEKIVHPLADGVAARLRDLANQENATLYMILLAALQVLLYRYCGQDDFALGAPVAGRQFSELEPLLGLFTNTLVMRADLSGRPTFRELLRRVQKNCLEAFDHQDMPFAKLVELLNPERQLSRNPLFEISFQLLGTRTLTLEVGGLKIEQLAIGTTKAEFDLSVEIIEQPELEVVWIYSCELFDAQTIQRMAVNFDILIASILQNPDQAVDELPLLSETELQQVLVDWNQTQRQWRDHCNVIEMFEMRTAQSPQVPAVIRGSELLTYHQLNQQANQLARCIQSLGAGPETVVAILLERSPAFIVSMLAVLKAGGAYLALDPNYPAEHLAFILEDSQAAILLTDSHLGNKIPAVQTRIFYLDDQRQDIESQPDENLLFHRQPDLLAYMIYTSGSTGLPKGVLIEDHSLANLAHFMGEIDTWGSGDRVLQINALNFDTSVEEIFGTLGNGATLVLRNEQMMSSIEAFLQESHAAGITIWDLPTAFWHLLTEEITRQGLALPPELRRVIVGGERMRPDLVSLWKTQIGDQVKLLNFYGPAETTVAATYADLNDLSTSEHIWREVPIGRPLHNVRAYVLDQGLHPAPIGVVGELYIGGAGVGRGYCQRPDLTAQVFLLDPFFPGERMYRTGDRALWLPDGNLEFTGRVDDQLKIRGFRVEPGEIEAVLHQHARVRDCLVTMHERTNGQPWLVAYIVSNHPEDKPEQELRSFLRNKLPEYMLPLAYEFLDKLPLTPGGKIDRRALPEPKFELSRAEVTPPRTEVENRLANIWSELLDVAQIGIHNNFFDLGGNSLLAMRVMAYIRKILGIELSVRILFESPTIAELAQWVELRIGWLVVKSDQAEREVGEL